MCLLEFPSESVGSWRPGVVSAQPRALNSEQPQEVSGLQPTGEGPKSVTDEVFDSCCNRRIACPSPNNSCVASRIDSSPLPHALPLPDHPLSRRPSPRLRLGKHPRRFATALLRDPWQSWNGPPTAQIGHCHVWRPSVKRWGLVPLILTAVWSDYDHSDRTVVARYQTSDGGWNATKRPALRTYPQGVAMKKKHLRLEGTGTVKSELSAAWTNSFTSPIPTTSVSLGLRLKSGAQRTMLALRAPISTNIGAEVSAQGSDLGRDIDVSPALRCVGKLILKPVGHS